MDLGLSALSPTVGLSGLRDPLGEATAALEARRRQQVENGRAPPWMRDIAYGIDNLFQQPLSAFIPPELRDRLPSAEMVGNLVLGALPGSGDYMAARDALGSSAASLSALARGDYMGAGARGVDALAAGLGIMPFLPYLASIKGVRNPIRAYHGSPHDFDKFDMSKIGSGEGAQIYGHGLYFAENEGVARSYRDALAPQRRIVSPDGMEIASKDDGGNFWSRFGYFSSGDAEKSRQGAALRRLLDASGDYESAVASAPAEIKDALRSMQKAGLRYEAPSPGRMYEVNIHANPQRFLDWDKTIGEQPGKAARKWADGILRKYLGRGDPDVYARYADHYLKKSVGELLDGDIESWSRYSGDYAAEKSTAMRKMGIPGIKYLDRGSRAAGDGSRNYVVFDDKLIEILRKYGIMAPLAGAGIGSLYLDGEEGGM